MAITLQLRRGTTSELSSISGGVGELFVDTDKDTLVIMDGERLGGYPLILESEIPGYVNSAISDMNIGFTWQVISTDQQLQKSNGYFIDTSVSSVNVTLPNSATVGDTIRINDIAGTTSVNNIVILRNGHKIQGLDSDLILDYDNTTVDLIYSNSTYGWKALGL